MIWFSTSLHTINYYYAYELQVSFLFSFISRTIIHECEIEFVEEDIGSKNVIQT